MRSKLSVCRDAHRGAARRGIVVSRFARAICALALPFWAPLFGCESGQPSGWGFLGQSAGATGVPAEEPYEPDIVSPASAQDESRPVEIGADALLAVLHLRIPERHAAATERVWTFLRESFADEDTHLRLRRNGIRCGIGSVSDWIAIRGALDELEGTQTLQAQPVRVPAGFPLALELDEAPRSQTIFHVDESGVLHGDTWQDSRNVLTVTYGADPRRPAQFLLRIAPEVHQDLDGWRWVRTASGLWQVPDKNRQVFVNAEFTVPLRRDEFILIAPIAVADSTLLLGRAFLTAAGEDGRYNSYMFLRPEVTDVSQHD